jgi:ABC-type tungstate transport system permease subunit
VDKVTPTMSAKTVRQCLATLGNINFEGCADLEQEFKAIKRAWMAKVLLVHPDKGGNPAEFRDVQTSFEVLRQLYESGAVKSFVSEGATSTSKQYNDSWTNFDFEGSAPPAWEYFSAAAEEVSST